MAGELTSCAKAGTAPNKMVENINQTSGDDIAFHSECICGNCTQRADAALSALTFFRCRRRPAEFGTWTSVKNSPVLDGAQNEDCGP